MAYFDFCFTSALHYGWVPTDVSLGVGITLSLSPSLPKLSQSREKGNGPPPRIWHRSAGTLSRFRCRYGCGVRTKKPDRLLRRCNSNLTVFRLGLQLLFAIDDELWGRGDWGKKPTEKSTHPPRFSHNVGTLAEIK